jgi:hypothetical protein
MLAVTINDYEIRWTAQFAENFPLAIRRQLSDGAAVPAFELERLHARFTHDPPTLTNSVEPVVPLTFR